MSDLEYCVECDDMTGNAGIHDGSLYLEDGTGPYCDLCFYRNSYEIHQAEIESQAAKIERLKDAIRHIHWSMGDELLNRDQITEVVCSLCNAAIKGEGK